MEVSYVNHMGDDLMVVNAARVSFNKESEWERGEPTHPDYDPLGIELHTGFDLNEGDRKLIRYLSRNGHWTPFSHPQITVRVKAPIFVARQLYKHKVGFTENEVSRRYVDDDPEFFLPNEWRGRPTNGAKQGSSEETVDTFVDHYTDDGKPVSCPIDVAYSEFLDSAHNLYKSMLDAGVAPEQARMVLPQAMYTEWYWSFSLAAGCRMLKQRLDPHAQAETREVSQMIAKIVEPLFPVSYAALMA